jgi:Tol biopolymer transport system component
MGEVYRARDTKLNRDVALKILPDGFALDSERLARFKREAQVLAALNHRNIAAIYGFEDSSSTHALVLELVEGPTLADLIAKGPIPLDEALPIAKQIAEALEAAHEQGVIHRDLKPANIKVRDDGTVKVLDFGLAKAMEPASATSPALTNSPTITSPAMVTRVGTFLGTAAYMAPEQAKGKPADKRSDIWAFGCVIYEMLTGRRAFDRDDVMDTLAGVLTQEPDWRALPAATPVPLGRLLRRALQKETIHRLASASDARLEIEDAQMPGPSNAPIATLKSKRGWIGPMIGALIIGLLAGGWLVWRVNVARPENGVLRLELGPPPGGRVVLGGTIVGDFAISPDGKTLAYSVSSNGKTGLWIRSLETATVRLLPGTDNAGQPVWAPNGRSLAFATSGTRVWRIDVAGGTPTPICIGYGIRLGSWSADGELLFSGQIAGGAFIQDVGIFQVPALGGTPTLLASPGQGHGEVAYRWPLIVTRGHLLFSVSSEKPDVSGVYAASLSQPVDLVKLLTTESKPTLASDGHGNSYLLWARGTALVAQQFDAQALRLVGDVYTIAEMNGAGSEAMVHISASDTGRLAYADSRDTAQLAWVDASGHLLTVVGAALPDVRMISLSPDERQIAVQEAPGDVIRSDLWLIDANRGGGIRFTSDNARSTQPVWSPDGRTIIFTHLGTGNLIRKAASGVAEGQVLLQRPHEVMPTDWSRDGEWVLSRERDSETGFDIWKVPVTPDGALRKGVAPTPYLRTRFNEQHARFSPELTPRWVAYSSDESGREEVYVDSFPEPHGRVLVSNTGGTIPQWASSGRQLFYVSLDEMVMSVDLTFGSDRVRPSEPRPLFRLPVRSPAGNTYQPSRDGKRFLIVTRPETAPPSLAMVINWPALLTSAAAAR